MYKCDNCGAFLEETELVYVEEANAYFCPHCGAEVFA